MDPRTHFHFIKTACKHSFVSFHIRNRNRTVSKCPQLHLLLAHYFMLFLIKMENLSYMFDQRSLVFFIIMVFFFRFY